MKKLALAFLLVFVVFFHAFSQGGKGGTAEVISGFRIEADRVVFTVFTTGYTDKSSFVLSVNKKESYTELTLLRVKDDPGKMMPEPLEVSFTRDELKDRVDIRGWLKILNMFSSIKL